MSKFKVGDQVVWDNGIGVILKITPKTAYIEQKHDYYRDDGFDTKSFYETHHRVKLDKLQLLSDDDDDD
jgi:RNA polymerase-interacting CarD/CdnL/TRCF family regulator